MADAPSGIVYADTSALVKLVIREAETEVLGDEIASWERVATSEITAIELPRAVARARRMVAPTSSTTAPCSSCSPRSGPCR